MSEDKSKESLRIKFNQYLEENKLLLPTNGFSGLAQESFAFTDELPDKGEITSVGQVWGFLESQESTAVSPQEKIRSGRINLMPQLQK